MAELTLNKVTKVYNPGTSKAVRAVDAVNMAIADGEIVGLLGSSGCGKTSTLRMIAGFEAVSAGEIRLGDRRLNDLVPAKRNVAMAFEGYALYPPLKVRDNIGFALLRDKHPRAEVQARVQAIAKLLEIDDILDRYPPAISAGQQQRTSLARALVRDADAFLLDEPMSQLEPQLRALLRARVKDWLISRRMTTVFVTHDQTEAVALADRIAVMEDGVLQQFASPAELRETPANLFVASFIGEPPMNVYRARIDARANAWLATVEDEAGRPGFTVDLPGDVPDLAGGRMVHLGVRPHRIEVTEGPGMLTGTVTSHHWLGDQTHLGLEIAGHILVAVAAARVTAPIGATIGVSIPPAALHLFDIETEHAFYHGRHAIRAAAS